MTPNQISAIILGMLALGVGGLSVWMHTHDKDGSGWGMLAFFLIVSSCTKAGG